MIAATFIFTIAAAGGGILLYNSPILFPGIHVFDVELGSLTKAEAAAALQTSWDQQQIELAAIEASWDVLPADLGITLDVPATIDQAYAQGRSFESWQQIAANHGALPVQPVWQIDMTAADAFLHTKADELAVPAQNARIDIVNGRVLTIPAVPGQALDVTATTTWLSQNGAQVVENGRLDLITMPVEPTITDVSAIAEQATALLTTSVSVRAYDPVTDDAFTWVVSPAVWGEWLTLDIDSC
jgi:vancomycin resistance protein YoaR